MAESERRAEDRDMEIALAIVLGLLFACAFAGIIAMTALRPDHTAPFAGPRRLGRRHPVPPRPLPTASGRRGRDRAA